ncbi:MAG TPA: winged helix-turn-helix transcriptional regulator [Methanocorpusculum sp.]|nr:winged helix-turn-helix transcriptional regulator [Methanocorpusculum sp.]
MPETNSKNRLDLFLNNGSITTIRNPIRLKIIKLLQANGSATFAEIQDMTGLSKSTVSTYVNSLSDVGIISRISDDEDHRKKSYVLSAQYVGSLLPSTYSAASEFRELIRKTYSNYDRINYKEMLPHIFRIALAEAGIHIDPVIKRGGIILGESIVPFIVSDTLEKTIENISEFWKRYEFGELSMRTENPLILDIYNCYECKTLPKGLSGGCIITAGILEAVFSAYYTEQMTVSETECQTRGDPCCSFEIRRPRTQSAE